MRLGKLASTLTLASAFTAANMGAASSETITWVTHPVIFAATGSGEMLKEFTDETGIEVNVITLPSGQIEQKLAAELAIGSDAFDVVSLHNAGMFTEETPRFLEPLSQYMAEMPLPDGGIEDFAPGFLHNFSVPQSAEGELYGIPNRMSVDILHYRKDLLEQAGLRVPKTLEEYYQAAKLLTQDTNGDGKTDIYGATMMGNHQYGLLDWYGWSAGLGGDILTPPDWGEAAVASDAGVKAMEMRRRFIEEGLASEAVLNYGFDDAINAMAQGKAAMSIMFSPYYSRLEDSTLSEVSGKMGYAVAPRNPEVKQAYFSRGWALFIPRASQNKEAAWKLISFLTNHQNQLSAAINFGNAPSRLSVVSDPSYHEKVPVANALSEALPRTKALPNISNLPEVYEELRIQLGRGLSGETTPEEALIQAQKSITEILNK